MPCEPCSQDAKTPAKPSKLSIGEAALLPSALAISTDGLWLAVGTTAGNVISYYVSDNAWQRISLRRELTQPVTALAWRPMQPPSVASDPSELLGALVAEGFEDGSVACQEFRRVTSGITSCCLTSP